MTTIDELSRDLASGLAEGPKLLDTSNVQAARLDPNGPPGLMVLIRTLPALSGQMAQCKIYEYCLQMPLNLMASFAAIVDHYEAGHFLPCPSELMAVVLHDVGDMENLGFRVDLARQRISSPHVPIAELNEAMDCENHAEFARLQKRLGIFGSWLATIGWLDTHPEGDELGVEFVFVPDLPVDDLSDSHLEHALRLAVGWNLTALLTPAAIKEKVANLRRALVEADTLITF